MNQITINNHNIPTTHNNPTIPSTLKPVFTMLSMVFGSSIGVGLGDWVIVGSTVFVWGITTIIVGKGINVVVGNNGAASVEVGVDIDIGVGESSMVGVSVGAGVIVGAGREVLVAVAVGVRVLSVSRFVGVIVSVSLEARVCVDDGDVCGVSD